MSDIKKSSTNSIVSTNLRDKISILKKTRNTCILADVSGSMDEYINPGERKIDALKFCLTDFKLIKLYAFSSQCYVVTELPNPGGSTALHRAFQVIKQDNIKKVILLTDGQPDNCEWALKEANGLEIHIIYIGPQPAPQFLADLASTHGGTFSIEEVKNRKAIIGKITGFLNA